MKGFLNIVIASLIFTMLSLSVSAEGNVSTEYQLQLNAEITCIYNQPNQKHFAGFLLPQTVTVIEEIGSGWKLIKTLKGERWINPELFHPTIELTEMTYIYNDKNNDAQEPIGILAPQTVLVLHELGNGWIKINTWLGEKWIKF